jgi:hypothetical protein
MAYPTLSLAAAIELAAASEPVAAALRERHFLRKHGPSAYYGQQAAGR